MSALAAPPRIEVSAARVRHGDTQAEDVTLRLGGTTAASLVAAHLRVGQRGIGPVELACRQLRMDGGTLRCRQGRVAGAGLPAPFSLDFELDTATHTGRGRLSAADAGALRIGRDGPGWHLKAENLALTRLPLPQLPEGWQIDGRLGGTLSKRDAVVDFDLAVHDGAFSNPDGTRAAEGLALMLKGRGRFDGDALSVTARLAWRKGGVYWAPLYRQAPLEVSVRWRRPAAAASRLTLDIAGEGWQALSIEGFGGDGWIPRQWRARWHDADLALLGPNLLAPWLDEAAPESWQFAGALSGSAEWGGRGLDGFALTLTQLGLGNPPRGLAVGPVDGRLRWSRGGRTEGSLEVSGLRWRRLAFGEFDLTLAGAAGAVVVETVRLPVLDGALVLERLRWRDDDGVAALDASAYLEPLSMEALTEALDWPRMSGRLSASLPGLRYRDRVLGMDGKLVVGVFGGYVESDGLRVVEPLGPVPRLQAEVRARHLDLGLLTDTFSFGHITGQLDFDVGGLELSGWRPQAFDAWLRSSPGDYPRRISQRAVENISALGGAGATAALQRSFLGLFESFGYKRLGLGCRLRAGVCAMRGLGELRGGEGYLIVEGGGLPALHVIGYNRRVDWRELLDRVAAVIESNAEPEIR
ncbi:MAG: hypothetical protein KDG52_03285 [Rhodocyclaceae bacterium]|nr:hypothetical protein [Rhodocyclaceae bacterium]